MRLRHCVAMLGIAIGATLAIAPGAQAAAMTFNVQLTIPFDFQIPLPCNGDTVDTTGFLHFVITVVTNGNNYTLESEANAHDITAISETTGANYRVTGMVNETLTGSFINGQSQQTLIQHIDFVGQGSAPSFTLYETLHVTVNANGTITANLDSVGESCG